jgi:hypothetical protein
VLLSCVARPPYSVATPSPVPPVAYLCPSELECVCVCVRVRVEWGLQPCPLPAAPWL